MPRSAHGPPTRGRRGRIGRPERSGPQVRRLVLAGDGPAPGYRHGAAGRPACPVLILDEPVNGLDLDGIQWIRALLTELARERAVSCPRT